MKEGAPNRQEERAPFKFPHEVGTMPHDSKNPAAGIIFERNQHGEMVILNPDLTVTIAKNGESHTFLPSVAQLEAWQLDAFDATIGFLDGVTLGPVGIRIATNYEAHVMARIGHRSDYAA